MGIIGDSELTNALVENDIMRIEAAAFRSFPPFADDQITFPASRASDEGLAEVHLITGENGCGKTRLLSALAAACGNNSELNARHEAGGKHQIAVTLSKGSEHALYIRTRNQLLIFENREGSERVLSKLEFLHPNADMLVEPNMNPERLKSATAQVSGWNPTLKFSAQAYRGTGRVTDHPIVAMQPISETKPALDLSFDRPKTDDALVCQSMANLKLSAAMEHQSGEPRETSRSIQITERFEAAISKVTGRSFSFQVARHPNLHLEVRWGGEPMKLAVLPDGLRSIIGWLVACIAKLESQFPDDLNPLDIPLILLLDEPESHLHPAWQRQLIPAAQVLFPNAQIFAATHSPFVISSVNSGWIHVLRMNEDRVITADAPLECSKGDSYLDAVEDVLGLTERYDPETESLLAKFRNLKKDVLSGAGSVAELEAKAKEIASRSESLSGMMGREMYQIQRMLPEREVAQ